MAKIALPYVHRFRDRHGTTRYYFRRPGYARATIPGLPGSPEFMAVYQAALAGQPVPVGAQRTEAGTMEALILAWYSSSDFKRLAPATQATYRGIAERIRADHGDKLVGDLDAPRLRRLLDGKADKPAAANNLLRIFKYLMRYAVERGWRKDDPTQGVRKVRAKVKGFHSWTEEEIAAFEEKWPLGTRARLALALLLYTGQRRGDVVRMGRQHLRTVERDGKALTVLDVVQNKTGARLTIPVHPALTDAKDAHKSGHLTFLTARAGKPFSPEGFSNWFTACARDAGLPAGCSPHGLRKAAARRLAEAGCTANEIGAITGHATLSEITRYTRAADQVRLAATAMSRLNRTAEA
ncbi:Site-specific recombinase XerD [Roseomonas rosea]|uniref:Site-specific recombinase XerD n=1 Tax=Muricoccus roseus TaxID=198092 RepID=A0A1M6Q0U6_9PROT|nr:site-specific integrase [Roseomonas rosea]SHK13830.1 Site-specific recombinase XerD [Roseomonas rosea]